MPTGNTHLGTLQGMIIQVPHRVMLTWALYRAQSPGHTLTWVTLRSAQFMWLLTPPHPRCSKARSQ